MPLSNTSEKVLKNMQKQYGAKKGKQVFYATASKKTGKPGRGTAEKAGTWKKKKGTSKEDIERIASELTEEFISESYPTPTRNINCPWCDGQSTPHKQEGQYLICQGPNHTGCHRIIDGPQEGDKKGPRKILANAPPTTSTFAKGRGRPVPL